MKNPLKLFMLSFWNVLIEPFVRFNRYFKGWTLERTIPHSLPPVNKYAIFVEIKFASLLKCFIKKETTNI